MSTLISESTARGTRRCDARRYNAHGPDCRCCCGGRNHGQGLARAVELNREWAAERGITLLPVQMELDYQRTEE